MFRDATDIPGGAKWLSLIDANRQGRWRGDFDRLARVLEHVRGIGAAKRPAEGAPPGTARGQAFKWIAVVIVLVVVAAAWMAMASDERIADDVVIAHEDEAVDVVWGGDTSSPNAAVRDPGWGHEHPAHHDSDQVSASSSLSNRWTRHVEV